MFQESGPMSHILAIEPDRQRRSLLKVLIRKHVVADVTFVDTVTDAIASFERRQPDLIVAPALLPVEDSDRLNEHVKWHGRPHSPAGRNRYLPVTCQYVPLAGSSRLVRRGIVPIDRDVAPLPVVSWFRLGPDVPAMVAPEVIDDGRLTQIRKRMPSGVVAMRANGWGRLQ